MSRPEDPTRDPASEMRDDHFDPDDREKARLAELAACRVKAQAIFEGEPPYTVEHLQKEGSISFVNQRFAENVAPKKLKLSALVDLNPGQLYHLSGYLHECLDAVVRAEKGCGLHDPANLDARVKWVACFREVVALRCPKNAVGTAIVSDLDLLQASARERLITFILWKSNHWKG